VAAEHASRGAERLDNGRDPGFDLSSVQSMPKMHEPHVKHLEGKLYVTAIGRRVVVVRAFVKKKQKTPRAEIELAFRRTKEIT
jgi:phage-related protein